MKKRTSMVKAATQATIPVQSKTSESIRMAQMDLFLSQLMQLPILELFLLQKATPKTQNKSYEKFKLKITSWSRCTPCASLR